ncbi:MAG: M42 family metallopeptidase [Bacillota bacterium]|jgi:putative aminopeptidase FrvX
MMVDPLGNLIALKRGKGGGKRIMLAAHMDEIGAQVRRIESDGRISLARVGWLWTASMYNDKVLFQNGTIGVVGCNCPVEEAKNDISKLYVDIGCTSKEDAEKFVKVGDYCALVGPYYELKNDCVTAKSLDDRVGCYLLIEAAKGNDGNRKNDVYYVFTVQEEVGCRGSKVAAERIDPDIGISVDVTPDHKYPCDLTGANEVGAGVGVKIGDPSAMLDEYLVDAMLECCEKNNIKYQRDVMDRGGTDASGMNRSGCGVRVAGISIVTRYPHSQSAVVSLRDVREATRLLDLYTALDFQFEDN